MSDAGPPPRDSAVFGSLDAFEEHDTQVDTDAMDRMLLNLTASSDSAEWQLDALTADPDFYTSTPSSYPSLPLHYIDTNPTTTNQTAHSNPQPNLHSITPTTQQQQQQQPSAPQNPSPQESTNVQVALDGRPTTSKSPPIQSLDASLSPSDPQNHNHVINVHTGSPAPPAHRKSHSSAQQKSPAISASSPRPRVPTARCPLCGKNISTNGANFRRHEQACRRQRAERVSAARPPSSPLVTNQQPQQAQPPPPQQQPEQHQHQHHHQQQQQQQQQAGSSAPQPQPRNAQAFPLSAAQQTTGLSRRDSDLLNVVRRLETSIGTLDVSARLCLRDALLSLSNKASNPNVPPTPEQEAMNRAAEYLVLRMLFLSGQQVMHTAPGTVGATYPPDAQAASSSVQGMASRSPQTDRDIAMNSGRPPGEPDDGTVAASTGTGGATVAKQEGSVAGSPLRPSSKLEDKLADGT